MALLQDGLLEDDFTLVALDHALYLLLAALAPVTMYKRLSTTSLAATGHQS
jgi:hypothetical protein